MKYRELIGSNPMHTTTTNHWLFNSKSLKMDRFDKMSIKRRNSITGYEIIWLIRWCEINFKCECENLIHTCDECGHHTRVFLSHSFRFAVESIHRKTRAHNQSSEYFIKNSEYFLIVVFVIFIRSLHPKPLASFKMQISFILRSIYIIRS